MRHVVIDQKGCQLSYERQILLIHHDSFLRPISLPFNQIQSLTISTLVNLSSNLLTKLSEHRIALCILPGQNSGKPCFLKGDWHFGVTRRCQQYEIVRNTTFCSHWATVIVKIKLRQQANLLRYLLTTSQQLSDEQQQAILQTCQQIHWSSRRLKTYFLQRETSSTTQIPRISPAYDIASLRGVEGASANQFFGCYQLFFNSQLNFNNRNRRPPKDPVNTVLSLGYTLLQSICEQAVYSVGFDPYLGVLHDISYGRASLACDFAELQRHEIELWVWQLFADGTLTLADFSLNSQANMAHRPCELLKSGRNRFYEVFSAIQAKLKKQALRNAWTWQKRICQSLTTDNADEVLQVSDIS